MPIKLVSEEPVLANTLKAIHDRTRAMRIQVLGKTRAGQVLGKNVDETFDWALGWMADVGSTMRSRSYMVGTLASLGSGAVVNRLLKMFPGASKALYGEER